jgi:hypothetical protein
MRKAENKAILLLLNNNLVNKYTGTTRNDPNTADGNRAANSLTPKINVARPERYIGSIGG